MTHQHQDKLKCRLCRENDASSIGSHIVNRELINWTLNEEGEGNKTDKEVAFTITPGRSTETYIGRKVSLGKIEGTLGRRINDEEIEANKSRHTYVRKYFLCVTCEKRLEKIESYAMNYVYNRIKANDCQTEEVIPDLSVATCEGINKELVRLYFYSLFWRGMESKVSYCRVKEWHKETLRRILHETLNTEINIIIQNASRIRDEINRYPLIIYYLTTTGDPTENFIHIAPTNAPYFYLLGDLAIQLFFRSQSVTCHESNLFGLDKFRGVRKLINKGDKPFSVGIVSEDFRKNVILIRFARIAILQEFKETSRIVSDFYARFFPNEKPSKVEIKRITYQILAESNDPSLPLGVRNSSQRKMVVLMQKFIEITAKKTTT